MHTDKLQKTVTPRTENKLLMKTTLTLKIEGKLTPKIRLPLWLQRDEMIEANEESEMNKKIYKDRRPLNCRLKVDFICRVFFLFDFN